MKKFRASLTSTAICAMLVFAGCAKDYPSKLCESNEDNPCNVDSNAINVRLINISGYPLCDVKVVYELNTGEVINYGRLDVDEQSCYAVFDAPKVYPRVTFTLGTGDFKIKDTLITDTLPYNNQKLSDPGFYSYELFVEGELNSLTCITRLRKEQ
ncbi:MAG: hypothetical protein RIC15_11965 [Vicingaceae bacterium]